MSRPATWSGSARARAPRSRSRRGAARSGSWPGSTARSRPGLIFIPFAYAEAAANVLTNPQLDPFGKIPEFKYCAAKLEAVTELVPA